MSNAHPSIDPITLSVVRGALETAQREMTTTLEKTARSSNASQLTLTGIFFGIFLWFTLNHPRARSLSAFRNDKQFSFL